MYCQSPKEEKPRPKNAKKPRQPLILTYALCTKYLYTDNLLTELIISYLDLNVSSEVAR